MLNIDDRLIKETLPKIKPNGLAVLLAIAIHLNKENTCFPSHERLMKLTGLGSETVYNALRALKKEGLLVSFQSIDSKNKTFSRRSFKVDTHLISVWVIAKNINPLEEKPLTDFPHTAQPDAVEPHTANHETYLLNEYKSINQLEQLNNEVEGAPASATSNLQSKKNENGLVAPGESPETEDVIFYPDPGQTIPDQVGVNLTKSFEDFGATAIASPTPLPGVTLVEAARRPLRYDEYPNPRNANELKDRLKEYFTHHPEDWRLLIENAKVNWLPDKVEETTLAYCLHQEKEGNMRRTYNTYKAGLTTWFMRQKSWDAQNNAPKEGGATRQNGQPEKTLISNMRQL